MVDVREKMDLLSALSDLETEFCAKLREIRKKILSLNKTTETKQNGLDLSQPTLPASSSPSTESPSPNSSLSPVLLKLPKPLLPTPMNAMFPTKPLLPMRNALSPIPSLSPSLSPSPILSLSPVSLPIVKMIPLKYIDVMLDEYVDARFPFVFSSRNFFLHTNYQLVEDFYIKFNEKYGADTENPNVKATLKLSKVEIKQLVCVYSESDMGFYRGQILKICEDGSFLVRYIDFGDMEKVKADNIFALYQEFSQAPAMAIQCFLDGMWERNFSIYDSIFLSFLSFPDPTDNFNAARVKFYPSVDGIKYPVSVLVQTKRGEWKDLTQTSLGKFSPAENIKNYSFDIRKFFVDSLKEGNFEKSPEAFQKFLNVFSNTMLKIGGEYPTQCVHVSSVTKFAFAKEGAFELITNMSFYYRGYLECPSAQNPVKERSLVVFPLGKYFFRGFVISESDMDSEVFSVDLGFTTVVSNSTLLALVALFSLDKCPPKALICRLDKVIPIHADYSNIASKTVETFFQDKLTLVPNSFSQGTYAVEVILKAKNRASELLVKFKLAKEAPQ